MMTWFGRVLSAFAAGDEAARNLAVEVRDNDFAPTIGELRQFLSELTESGFARWSKKKRRYRLDHPALGRVEWKTGVDFRTARDYLFVWLNGAEILTAWPFAGEGPRWLETRAYHRFTPAGQDEAETIHALCVADLGHGSCAACAHRRGLIRARSCDAEFPDPSQRERHCRECGVECPAFRQRRSA